jgi:hypothetical protein
MLSEIVLACVCEAGDSIQLGHALDLKIFQSHIKTPVK